MCANASTRSRGGILPIVGVRQVSRFAFGPDLIIDFDVELNKGIEIIWCGLVRKGLSKFTV